MKERNRENGIFRSLRMRRKKNKEQQRTKSASDDSQIMYSSDTTQVATTTTVTVNVTSKENQPDQKGKKTNWTNIFKPWKWRRKKKEVKNAVNSSQKIEPEKNENHVEVEDANQIPPPKPERTFTTVELPNDGDSSIADGGSYTPLVTQAQINQSSEANSSAHKQDLSNQSQVNSTVHDDVPVTGYGDAEPPLPPKKGKSPTAKGEKPTPAPRVRTGGRTTIESPQKRAQFAVNNSQEGHCNGDINHSNDDSDSSDYDNVKYADDDDDDEGEYNTNLATRVKRNDSLAFHLSNRPSRTLLEQRNIIPTRSPQDVRELREIVGAKLVRRLSERPSKEELAQRNIYRDKMSETVLKQELEEKKKTLVRKLSFRPTIEELRERNIIMFNEYVEVIEAVSYDRKADKPWTRLTPQDKAMIRKELNDFKSSEMAVHDESRKYTRFHKP